MGAGRPDRSFPKACRLVSSDDFRRAYRTRNRGRVGPFGWHARTNDCQHPRLGLAVPKRAIKRSTDRSRVKRLIRESFRHNRDRLPAADIVVSVRTQPADLHDPAIHDEIRRIWDAVLASIGEPRESIVQ
ncbi:MAG: ribonuclease P protein component [Gammaproteobacteria bacterium]|nr:ribonuclease P protein component [Gammaproteobacteria bacterium]